MGNRVRHKLSSRPHDTVRVLLPRSRSIRTSRLPEPALHPSKPYAWPNPRLLWTWSFRGGCRLAARCGRYTSTLIVSIQRQVAVWGYFSEATAVIVQFAGFRFCNSCSFSELGRHWAVADPGRSASGHGCLLLDGLKRSLSLNILGSGEHRSLSITLFSFLKP